MKKQAFDSQNLVARIRPLLAGQDPGVVGAALADLTAMWIAAHLPTEPGQKEPMRNEMLKLQFSLIAHLIPVNERIILERLAAANGGPDGVQEENRAYDD